MSSSPILRGRFITFEGPEGGGKTTQARRLIQRLEEAGTRVVYTREPGGTPTGELIRGLLQHETSGEHVCAESEVLLFAASRAQLVRRVILPALASGSWVVCDRFADSTTAYQGYGRGFPLEQINAINSFAVGEAIPDLTFLLDLDVERGMERLAGRQGGAGAYDRIEREELAFHRRVRDGYLEIARREAGRFRVIDAGRPADSVADEVWRLTRDVLGR
jgi:dTMP kinase